MSSNSVDELKKLELEYEKYSERYHKTKDPIEKKHLQEVLDILEKRLSEDIENDDVDSEEETVYSDDDSFISEGEEYEGLKYSFIDPDDKLFQEKYAKNLSPFRSSNYIDKDTGAILSKSSGKSNNGGLTLREQLQFKDLLKEYSFPVHIHILLRDTPGSNSDLFFEYGDPIVVKNVIDIFEDREKYGPEMKRIYDYIMKSYSVHKNLYQELTENDENEIEIGYLPFEASMKNNILTELKFSHHVGDELENRLEPKKLEKQLKVRKLKLGDIRFIFTIYVKKIGEKRSFRNLEKKEEATVLIPRSKKPRIDVDLTLDGGLRFRKRK